MHCWTSQQWHPLSGKYFAARVQRRSSDRELDLYASMIHPMQMRITLNIDDHILKKASELTGVKEKTSLVRMGLGSTDRS